MCDSTLYHSFFKWNNHASNCYSIPNDTRKMHELKKQVVVCLLIFLMPLGGSDCEFAVVSTKRVSLARRQKKAEKKWHIVGAGACALSYRQTPQNQNKQHLE